MTTIVTIFTQDGIPGEVQADRCLQFAQDAVRNGVSSVKARIGAAFVEIEQYPDGPDEEPITPDAEIEDHEIITLPAEA